MNLTPCMMSKKYNMSNSYFSEMRLRNYPKYRYIRFIGYNNFIDEEARLRHIISQIYYFLLSKKELSKFYRSHLLDTYPSKNAFIVSVESFSFYNAQSRTRWDAFKRMKHIEKTFNKVYKNDIS